MDHESWSSVLARLKGVASLTVDLVEIGDPATDDDREVLKLMNAAEPPPPIMNFFREANGVKLLWHGEINGKRTQGSVNIVTLVQSAIRAPATPGDEPLEGVLWDAEFSAKARRQLQSMSIFEQIAGRSAYLTYNSDDPTGRLFLVDDDEIHPIVPDFVTTINLLKRYAGIEGLREILILPDWSDRLKENEAANWIAA